MIVGLLIGAICAILYFTYKPLFKTLKNNSFSLSKFSAALKENPEIKQEFEDFSKAQMQKLLGLIAGKNKETKQQDDDTKQ